ncbi:AAA family ATPase [Pantoea vagans]|uniref:AAA family ATPase n=1 Tax=Pantoea vagans TaxID=470934 RepID=UPI00225AAA09|nr:AAA family ATPase [Pantoea vagans]MCX3308623.1 AAA family ATPase [Pantoea vagans]
MNSALTLEALGPRICIMGPSNSGKSTLAEAISRKTNLPVVHLDQLHHLPDSQWIPRAAEAFRHLHADAVSQEKWVMEGNYTKCVEERFAQATGLILLDVKVTVALLRYIRRCYSSTPRIGGLGMSRESVTLEMLKYIIRTAPQNRKYHQTLYDQVRLPKVLLHSPHEIKACSEYWGLKLKISNPHRCD